MSDPFTIIGQFIKDLLTSIGIDAVVADIVLTIVAAVILGSVVGAVAIFTIWAERKLLARIQDRLGPNRVGPYGLLQSFADVLKLITKEFLIPKGADRYVFLLAPLVVVGGVIGLWAVMPLAPGLVGADINVGLLYIIAIGAIGTLGIIMAGLSSNNKYAMLGAFRAVAQMLSYTVPLILALLVPVMLAGSMGMTTIVEAQSSTWFIFLAPLAGIIFFISSIAELGRTPFDLLEAESEIVAGFHIEYSGMGFGMFMMGEFVHAFTVSALFVVIFLGGWQGPGAEAFPPLGFFYFILKTALAYFVIIWIRGTIPRIRIDQMNAFNWKFITPLALAVFVTTALLDKLAIEAGFNRTAIHLAANAIIVLVTAFLIRAHAASLRRQAEAPRAPIQKLESAGD
jgi:NADH-quinone oxidoreductase subunit H